MDLQNLLSLLSSSGAVDNLANKTGIKSDTLDKVLRLAGPAILSGMAKNTQSIAGQDALNSALDNHDPSLLNNLGDIFNQTDSTDGQKILAHVFGNQQEKVTSSIAKKQGIDVAKVGSAMALLAPVVMSYLAKEKKTNRLPKKNMSKVLKKSSSGFDLKSLAFDFLDKNNDGSVVDDIAGNLINYFKK